MKMILLSVIAIGFLFSRESTAIYRIDGMMCSMNCPKKVNESLNGIEGITSCSVDFESKITTVVYDDEKINSDQISKTIAKSTYYKIKVINEKEGYSSFWNWLFGKS